MRKIRIAIMTLATVVAFGACSEVPVKEVKKCARVVDVKIFRSYFLGFLPERESRVYKILDSGERIYLDSADYYKWDGEDWLEAAKRMEIGNKICWTEYERMK